MISKDLKNFLKKNKIFSIDSFKILSKKKICSLPGYKDTFHDEIIMILSNNDVNKKKVNEKNKSTQKFNEHSYSSINYIRYNNEKIKISVRLLNILNESNYSFETFLFLSDHFLLSLPNFGVGTLNEVKKIRQKYFPNHFNYSELSKIKSDPYQKNFEVGYNDKIKVPSLLHSLPSVLLNNLNRGNESLLKSLNSLVRLYPRIGDFDDKTIQDIFSNKSIGIKKIKVVWGWFLNFHSESFSSLISILFNDKEIMMRDIHYSYHVAKLVDELELYKTSDLIKLDSFKSFDLSFSHKIALLELRTLYYDSEKLRYSTRTNHQYKTPNFFSDLDSFIDNFLNDKDKAILLQRWNHKTKKTLVEVAKKNNFTRERARQVLQKITNDYKKLFIADFAGLEESISKKFIKKKQILKMEDICSIKDYKFMYKIEFYENFYNDIFDLIHIGKSERKSAQHGEFRKLSSEIFKKAHTPFYLSFDELEKVCSKEKLKKIVYISFIPDVGFKFVVKNDQVFINRLHYSSFKTAIYIIKNSDIAISIDQINNSLEKMSLKKSDPLGLVGRLNDVDGIYNLDYQIFGTENHFGYQRNEWKEIIQECKKIISDFGHQMSASAIFNEIKDDYPKIRSKYELVYVIRSSKDIVDIGFHTFTLKKFGQTKRTLLKDVVLKSLKDIKTPVHRSELYKMIIKKRTLRFEAMSMIHRIEGVELYFPGYYGLLKNEKANRDYLSTHLPFIENFILIKTQHSFDTSIEAIMHDINFQENQEAFIELIKESNDLVVLNTNENNFTNYLVSKKFSVLKCALVLLRAYNRKMLLSEIKLLLKNKLNKPRGLEALRRNLKNNKGALYDGKNFYYNSNLDKLQTYGELLSKIENDLKEYSEIISIDDLFDLMKGEKNLPQTSLLLLGLLKLDDRFEILDKKLISLKGK